MHLRQFPGQRQRLRHVLRGDHDHDGVNVVFLLKHLQGFHVKFRRGVADHVHRIAD